MHRYVAFDLGRSWLTPRRVVVVWSILHVTLCSQDRTNTKHDNKWLEKAIKEANAHRKRMRTVIGCRDEDLLQVHIFAFYCLGTVKRNLLEQIKANLDKCIGLVVVFYLFIPKGNQRRSAGSGMDVEATEAAIGAGAAIGADAESLSDDSDVDPDLHDYDANGTLPEALTSVYSVRSAGQRLAQLAKDCNQVDNTLGMADIDARFPKALTFDHRTDNTGDQTASRALVLIPVESGHGIVHDKLQESTMFKSGNYLQAPVPTQFARISKKISMQAKRAMSDHYTFDASVQEQQGQRFAASKVSRGQMGITTHEMWMKDVITNCGVKAVMFCDYAHGSSEIQCAAINCKVSQEAVAANVRVLSWAHDPRRVFAEVGRARGRSDIAKYYLQNKLSLPGHLPIPSPGEPATKSRKLINSMLEKPLTILSMSKNGDLIIPSDDTIKRFCPVELPQDAKDNVATWREKFPAPSDSAIGENETPQNQVQDQGTQAKEESDKTNTKDETTIAVGTALSPEELESYGEQVVKEANFPDSNPSSHQLMRLALAKTKNSKRRVWFHNIGKKDISLNINTFVGKGGPGAFVSLVAQSLPESKQKHAWKYNRITNHKKDSSSSANAYLVWMKDPAAIGAAPNLVSLEGIEKQLGSGTNAELYAHSITRGGKVRVTITPSPTPIYWHPEDIEQPAEDAKFDWQTLGRYYPSGDSIGSTNAQVEGGLRPAFEVSAKAQPGGKVQLAPNPNKGTNPLHLFTKDKMIIPAGKYVAVHAVSK